MLDLLSTLLSYVTLYGPVVLSVLGALTLFVGAIAKLTPTDKDDKVVDFLSWLHDKLSPFVAHPKLQVKQDGKAIQDAGARVVVDHRTGR